MSETRNRSQDDSPAAWVSPARWLALLVVGWIITDEILSELFGLIPPPWSLIQSAAAFAWTPWSLVTVLFAFVLILGNALYQAITIMEQMKDDQRNLEEAAMGAIDAKNEHIDCLDSMLIVARRLIRLESDILFSLDNLVLAENVPLACKNMVKIILLSNAHLLDQLIFRCYVLRPEGDYLKTYISQQMPEPDGYERKFYIGEDVSIRRGVAGTAFKQRSIEITRRVENTDEPPRIVFDHSEFVPLDTSSPPPQYRAIICIPVRPDRDRCLGVLCLDSEDPIAFDDIEIQEHLSALGIIIGFVLDLSDIAERRHAKSDQWPLDNGTRTLDTDLGEGDTR